MKIKKEYLTQLKESIDSSTKTISNSRERNNSKRRELEKKYRLIIEEEMKDDYKKAKKLETKSINNLKIEISKFLFVEFPVMEDFEIAVSGSRIKFCTFVVDGDTYRFDRGSKSTKRWSHYFYNISRVERSGLDVFSRRERDYLETLPFTPRSLTLFLEKMKRHGVTIDY